MLAPARSSSPRSSRLAPGTRELHTELETHVQATADEFDRSM
jgi:heme oxygenase